MQVEASRGPLDELDVQALAVAVFKNEKPDDGFLNELDELSGGLVRSALDAEEFTEDWPAMKGEQLLKGNENRHQDEKPGANP